MKRIGIGALTLFALLVIVGLLRGPQAAHAQDEQPQGNLTAWVGKGPGGWTGQAMVSVIKDGKIVFQSEVKVPDGINVQIHNLQEGQYDVRFEGDGAKTLVKRGIAVFNLKTTSIEALMIPGQGVHIVEYATGGLSRDETASLLRKLVADIEDLKKSIDELKKK